MTRAIVKLTQPEQKPATRPPTPAQLAARFKANAGGEIVDPRINRRGRPKKPRSQKDLEALIDDVFDELVTMREEVKEGETKKAKKRVTRLKRAIIEQLESNNALTFIHLLDRRFGKIKEQREFHGELKFRSWLEFINYDGNPDDAAIDAQTTEE